MNDGQVHTIGSLDTFLNPEDHKAIAERIARSRQTAGVEVTSRDYSKTSNFVPRRMRKTRPVLSCHRQYSRGTAVGRQAARCASGGPGANSVLRPSSRGAWQNPTSEADIRRNPNRSMS